MSAGRCGQRAEGTARGRVTLGTRVQLGRSSSSVWGLPLQFDFVGSWLGVHGVRDPAVFSAQGSVGGSTKAQLGPVPSQSSRLRAACGRKSCWQWASLPAHAHPVCRADKGGGGEAGDKGPGCLWPPGAPSPREGQGSGSGRSRWGSWGLPSLHRPPLPSKEPQISWPPLPAALRPICSSVWPKGHPLLIETSGLPPTSVAAPSLPPLFLRTRPGWLLFSHPTTHTASRMASKSISKVLHVS